MQEFSSYNPEREKQFLLEVMKKLGIHDQGALEIIGRYDENALNEPEFAQSVREFSGQYGLRFEEDFSETEQKEAATLFYTIDQVKGEASEHELVSALTRLMHEGFARRALNRLDELKDQLTGIREAEEVKKTLRSFLESMATLARQIPPEQKENEEFWRGMVDRFKSIASSRKEMEGQVRLVFDEIIEEFRPFIEDELVAREAMRRMRAGSSVSSEHLMREIYGRTPKELEVIKQRNRGRVTQEIMEMKDEPYVTLEMILKLYEINNLDIMPRSEMRLREDTGMSFGVRRGILPEDVREEMTQFIERVNNFVDETILHDVSDLRYEMTAAKFHNEMLDIHPLPDRNGSTALLFLELLMARRGYEASGERESDYYKHLLKALGDNLLAVGIVSYEQFRIRYVPGYFEGTTTRDLRKRKEYEVDLERIKAFHRALAEARKKKRAA